MYTQELPLSLNIYTRMRKKLSELNSLYSGMGVTFTLTSEPGNHNLFIKANRSDDFNQALREMNQIIFKLNSDYNNLLNRRKMQKEKKERNKMKNAAKKIQKNFNNNENNENNENLKFKVTEEGLKRNPYYLLQDDVPCVPTYNGIPKCHVTN